MSSKPKVEFHAIEAWCLSVENVSGQFSGYSAHYMIRNAELEELGDPHGTRVGDQRFDSEEEALRAGIEAGKSAVNAMLEGK